MNQFALAKTLLDYLQGPASLWFLFALVSAIVAALTPNHAAEIVIDGGTTAPEGPARRQPGPIEQSSIPRVLFVALAIFAGIVGTMLSVVPPQPATKNVVRAAVGQAPLATDCNSRDAKGSMVVWAHSNGLSPKLSMCVDQPTESGVGWVEMELKR